MSLIAVEDERALSDAWREQMLAGNFEAAWRISDEILQRRRGVPTWLLLHHAADWRWMKNRGDSPWYSSLRLFRQPSPGDWRAVLTEVREASPRIAH